MAKAKQKATSRNTEPVVVPAPPLASRAIPGAIEPMILAAPPAGKSGDLNVHKAIHALLSAEPEKIAKHVLCVKANFTQDTKGKRSVALRLDLDEDFPNFPLRTLPAKLKRLQKAGAARCAAVLGPDFSVLSVYFGGKKLR